MLSIVKVASFFLLASQGVTCSEGADEGPIIGKSLNFSSMLVMISHNSKETNSKKITSGIDLGTTYSCVAVMEGGKVTVIANDQGNRITPSYVAFTESGERLIGDAAKNQLTSNPKNTIFDAKRLIGREWEDSTVQGDAKYFPFSLEKKGSKPVVKVTMGDHGDKQLTPEEISAMVLTKMKATAESYLEKNITRAVVTVPAYFNDAQRAATKDAGTIAGLNIVRIINEPTAAAIAYGVDKNIKGEERNVLVFDLGGGTFDVSLLTISDGVFEVLATSGDTHLGGEDFDQRVMDHFIKLIKKKMGKDIRSDNRAVQKLRREVEKAKRALSSTHQTRLEIESLVDGQDFSETLTRAKFEELNIDLFKKTLKEVKKVLDDAELTKKDIDDIILVGGSTRIPKVKALVKEFFNGKEPRSGVNPDEAVAEGAALQACILSGDRCGDGDDLLVIDTNPLSLGIETVGGVMSKVIPRNTAIPTKKSQVFSTAADNQETVTIKVYEGERPMTKDNHLLGTFDLTGIPPAPRGTPQIEVTFQVNADGMLEVNAKDKASDREEKIVINKNSNSLSPEDIEKMLADAEKFAEEDREVADRVTAKNELEGLCYNLKKQAEDKEGLGGKLSESDKEKILEVVEEKLTWLRENGDDAAAEELKTQKKELEEVSQPIIAGVYKQEGDKSTAGEHHSDDEL